MDSRTQFKARFRRHFDVREILSEDKFVNNIVEHMWLAWQASQEVMLPVQAEPVGSLHISHFRDNPAMENVDFQLIADLKPGSYKLYLHPQHRLSTEVSDGTGNHQRA